MICVLQGGPNSSEHFQVHEDFAPPKEVWVKIKPTAATMYEFRRFKGNMAVFEYKKTVHHVDQSLFSKYGLFRFVDWTD